MNARLVNINRYCFFVDRLITGLSFACVAVIIGYFVGDNFSGWVGSIAFVIGLFFVPAKGGPIKENGEVIKLNRVGNTIKDKVIKTIGALVLMLVVMNVHDATVRKYNPPSSFWGVGKKTLKKLAPIPIRWLFKKEK